MPDLTAKRTLVKSPPELWEELSEVERLAKHLGAFGEIRITKLEPEHTVAWEGEHASGTVSIEPAGWGTKVTLHAELPEARAPEPESGAPPDAEAEAPEQDVEAPKDEAAPEAEAAAPDPEPPADAECAVTEPDREAAPPEAPRRRRFWAWLFRQRTERVSAEPEPVVAEPEPVATEREPEPLEVEPEPEPVAAEPEPLAAEPEPEPESAGQTAASLDPERARLVLDEALDALGAAHHRPFSRA